MPALAELLPDTSQLELAADQAISACGGDMTSAIKALLLANAFYEAEIESLKTEIEMWRAAASHGYVRGKRDWTDDEIVKWGLKAFDRADRQDQCE